MKILVLTCYFSLINLIYSDEYAPPILYHDGTESVIGDIASVTDVQEVNKNPIFDNAPFLKIKKNDRFVRARC